MSAAFDLAVIGGGPAGAAAALTAARSGLAVVLFEAQRGARDKPCGEGLMPEGIRALAELGLGDAVASGRTFERLRYVLPGGDTLDVPLPGAGLALDRPRLQESLDEALAREPTLTLVRARAHAEREGGVFLVRAGEHVLRARALALADGAGGRSAPWMRSGRPSGSRRFGVRARFAESEPLDLVEVHLGPGCEVYLTPLPPARGDTAPRVNASILVDGALAESGGVRGAAGALAWALARHGRARAHLGALVSEPEARALGQSAPRRRARAGAFLLGDAGGSVDPILGCGVTIALQTGILAGRAAVALSNGADPERVARDYDRAYRREASARRRLAQTLHLLSSHPKLLAATAAVLRRAPVLLDRMAALAAG